MWQQLEHDRSALAYKDRGTAERMNTCDTASDDYSASATPDTSSDFASAGGGRMRSRNRRSSKWRALCPDRRCARHHDDLVCRLELYDIACSQQWLCDLRARDHQMAEPGTEPVPGIVPHHPHLGRSAESIGDALGGPFVVGREADTHMAVVEDRVIRPIGLLDLVQRLRDQRKSSGRSWP